jgi:hypothetical protein
MADLNSDRKSGLRSLQNDFRIRIRTQSEGIFLLSGFAPTAREKITQHASPLTEFFFCSEFVKAGAGKKT